MSNLLRTRILSSPLDHLEEASIQQVSFFSPLVLLGPKNMGLSCACKCTLQFAWRASYAATSHSSIQERINDETRHVIVILIPRALSAPF